MSPIFPSLSLTFPRGNLVRFGECVIFAFMDFRIYPPQELLMTRVKLPLSKSISNRLLIINALTPGGELHSAVADCDDTRAIVRGLSTRQGEVNIGAAGTAMRFLTAFYAATAGCDVTLDGSERMRQRPIGPLVDALRSIGAEIQYLDREGFPPLAIHGRKLDGGKVVMPATVSSQFVSAMMMIAPATSNGIEITLEGEPISAPYIKMTASIMGEMGAGVEMEPNHIVIEPRHYTATPLEVEADWSAAAFWYEIEALSSGFVTVDGLRRFSIQGDSRAAEIFDQLGVNTEYDGENGGVDLEASPDCTPRLLADMTDTPDLVQPIAVTCVMLNIPFRLTGVQSLRIKETDRLEALRREMLKIGCVLTIEGDDALVYECERFPIHEMPVFDTYNDHRMAMALAPVALYIPGIVIRNVEVVGKSYPYYWDDLKAAQFVIEDAATPVTDEKE